MQTSVRQVVRKGKVLSLPGGGSLLLLGRGSLAIIFLGTTHTPKKRTILSLKGDNFEILEVEIGE